MSTQVGKVEQIKKYIEKTGFSNIRYDLNIWETYEMVKMESPLQAIELAFRYGQAKGYRAAKAEAKKC